MTTTSKRKETNMPVSLSAIFGPSKATYRHVAEEFHAFHRHDLNVAAHLFTTGLGVWGALQLAVLVTGNAITVYVYAVLIALTTPLSTAVAHTAFVAACLYLDLSWVTICLPALAAYPPLYVCTAAITAGYGLQDLAHYLACEPTYMGSYLTANPWMLVVHSVWLMPLVIDAVAMRWCFLPNLPTRNRCVFCRAASQSAVEDLRKWIQEHVPSTPETVHVWPHEKPATSAPTQALESDAAILAAFRKVFAAKHFDVAPVPEMNEIYVTAVGAKKEINSDAVFYTPHTDGPYWFLPGASLYRVLVGVTDNQMVRTRFNLQYEAEDKVLDRGDVLGFDYNRELHWIDHVPGTKNTERRSLLKLHFIVYPKGWTGYGRLCAKLNTNYNTWARGNFLKTLRPQGFSEFVLAWWIWLTTWFNALFEEHIGWSNLVYILASYAAGPTPFLLLTSFRHYCDYITTFAFREPKVAHGYLMRDARLYKTLSMMHLGRRLVPMVDLPEDLAGVLLAGVGFSIAILATARLGMIRTYYGTELGLVKPQWINGFPYGTIPHPMINGQIFAFLAILWWFWERLSSENVALLVAHIGCYATHMFQEILFSSY